MTRYQRHRIWLTQNLHSGLNEIKLSMTQNRNRQKPASARMVCSIDMVPPIACRRRNRVTTSDQVNFVSGGP
jgi:hypothetical protein